MLTFSNFAEKPVDGVRGGGWDGIFFTLVVWSLGLDAD